MISVCMATYNGGAFINRQLDSIMPQLSKQDEVIIVDDCSTDNTVQLIKQRNDCRIQLIQNQNNVGPMLNFQKSLQHASGDIIFLSDQDDIWLDEKVKKIVPILTNGEADLVVHDAVVMDGNLEEIQASWNQYNGNTLPGTCFSTIVSNGYTGCMMAFKKEMVSIVTPLPKTIEMHDQWIALVAMMEKKRIVVLPDKLMNYIRHGNNVTAIHKRPFLKKIKGRIGTIRAVCQYKLGRRK